MPLRVVRTVDGGISVHAAGAAGLDNFLLPLARTEFSERTPTFSPDGRWIAYRFDETRREEVYVRAYPGPGGRHLLSLAGGMEPVWSSDSRELFYRESDRLMTVFIGDGANFVAGRPEFFCAGYDFGFGGTANFDVTPDGQRFVMIQTEGSGLSTGPPQLRVVQNWFEELTRLVPTP